MSNVIAMSWRREKLRLPDSPRGRSLPPAAQAGAARRLSIGDEPSAYERRHLEDEELLASTGRMVYGIAHDIRHYLAAIPANLDIMNDPRVSHSSRIEAVQDIRDAITDICNMLDLTLLCSCHGSQIPASIENVGAIVQHAIRMVHCHPDGKAAEINFDCPLSFRQRVNSVLLLSAFYNLILNASQAIARTKALGRVNVTITRSIDATHARIEDNGPGIPLSMQNSLFDSFRTKRTVRTGGLGIAIADYAATAHGGSLTLEQSRLGKTVFCLTIPYALSSISTIEDQCSKQEEPVLPETGRR